MFRRAPIFIISLTLIAGHMSPAYALRPAATSHHPARAFFERDYYEGELWVKTHKGGIHMRPCTAINELSRQIVKELGIKTIILHKGHEINTLDMFSLLSKLVDPYREVKLRLRLTGTTRSLLHEKVFALWAEYLQDRDVLSGENTPAKYFEKIAGLRSLLPRQKQKALAARPRLDETQPQQLIRSGREKIGAGDYKGFSDLYQAFWHSAATPHERTDILKTLIGHMHPPLSLTTTEISSTILNRSYASMILTAILTKTTKRTNRRIINYLVASLDAIKRRQIVRQGYASEYRNNVLSAVTAAMVRNDRLVDLMLDMRRSTILKRRSFAFDSIRLFEEKSYSYQNILKHYFSEHFRWEDVHEHYLVLCMKRLLLRLADTLEKEMQDITLRDMKRQTIMGSARETAGTMRAKTLKSLVTFIRIKYDLENDEAAFAQIESMLGLTWGSDDWLAVSSALSPHMSEKERLLSRGRDGTVEEQYEEGFDACMLTTELSAQEERLLIDLIANGRGDKAALDAAMLNCRVLLEQQAVKVAAEPQQVEAALLVRTASRHLRRLLISYDKDRGARFSALTYEAVAQAKQECLEKVRNEIAAIVGSPKATMLNVFLYEGIPWRGIKRTYVATLVRQLMAQLAVFLEKDLADIRLADLNNAFGRLSLVKMNLDTLLEYVKNRYEIDTDEAAFARIRELAGLGWLKDNGLEVRAFLMWDMEITDIMATKTRETFDEYVYKRPLTRVQELALVQLINHGHGNKAALDTILLNYHKRIRAAVGRLAKAYDADSAMLLTTVEDNLRASLPSYDPLAPKSLRDFIHEMIESTMIEYVKKHAGIIFQFKDILQELGFSEQEIIIYIGMILLGYTSDAVMERAGLTDPSLIFLTINRVKDRVAAYADEIQRFLRGSMSIEDLLLVIRSEEGNPAAVIALEGELKKPAEGMMPGSNAGAENSSITGMAAATVISAAALPELAIASQA